MAARDHERIGRRPVVVADGHAREIDEVQQVRVDELGREVEGEDVEVVRGPVRVDAEEREARGAHRGLHIGPRCVGALGTGAGALVEQFVEDLEPLVGQPDLVSVGVDQEKCSPAGAVFGRQAALFHSDVASGLLNPGQERFDPRPQV